MKRKLPKPIWAWACLRNGVIDPTCVYRTRTLATYYAGFNWRAGVVEVEIRPVRRKKRSVKRGK